MTPAFVAFPKIGRWSNNKIAITEKIDGTNGSIDLRWEPPNGASVYETAVELTDPTVLGAWYMAEAVGLGLPLPEEAPADAEQILVMRAGSRSRWLTRGADNYGFAAWVQQNRNTLVRLGVGLHFGEWWGSGIQRGYGLQPGDKRFSLFNVGRWVGHPVLHGVYDRGDNRPDKALISVPGLSVVPTLHYGAMRDNSGQCQIEQTMRRLQFAGSQAAPGFKGEGKAGPEGCMVYFEALKTYSKVPFDGLPKGLAL